MKVYVRVLEKHSKILPLKSSNSVNKRFQCLGSQQPLGWDLQPVESVEVTKPIDPIEEEVTPAGEVTSGGQEPIMEEPEPEPDQSTVLESVRESIKTEDDLVSVPEDVKSSPALSSAGNAVAEVRDYIMFEIYQKWDEICFNCKKWKEICQNFTWDELCLGRNLSLPFWHNNVWLKTT